MKRKTYTLVLNDRAAEIVEMAVSVGQDANEFLCDAIRIGLGVMLDNGSMTATNTDTEVGINGPRQIPELN